MSQQNARRRARIKENGFEKITVAQWLAIIDRTGHKCIYCDTQGPVVVDHFIPISKGGGHVVKNIVPACKKCNSSKWNRSPQQWVTDTFGLRKYQQIVAFIAENH